jgi:NAD(P)-dependent dehydrogenase (short-subunit alcohol dehydrogenase family)
VVLTQVTPQPTLPGTIYSVAAEVEAMGVEAMAVKVDIRNEDEINACVAAVAKRFGGVDILINKCVMHTMALRLPGWLFDGAASFGADFAELRLSLLWVPSTSIGCLF